MNCHQQDGQLPKYDEIRDFQLAAGPNAREIEEVLALYVPRAELQAAFDGDQNRYRTARAELGITKVSNTTMHTLDDAHLGVIDLNTVAAVIGLRATDLQRAIDASPQALPEEIVTLRTKGGGIQRDAFENIVGTLVDALGLGEQLLVNNAGARRNAGVVVNNNNNNNNSNVADAGVDAGRNNADAGVGADAGRSSGDAGVNTPRR